MSEGESDAPGDGFVTVRIYAADHARLRALRAAILEHGTGALPPPLAERLRAALVGESGRHKSVGLCVVLSLALDVLEASVSAAEGRHNGP